MGLPIIKKAILDKRTGILTLNFQSVPDATAYTVIVRDTVLAYNTFKINPGQTSIEGVNCADCMVAMRALNRNDRGEFTKEFLITSKFTLSFVIVAIVMGFVVFDFCPLGRVKS